MTNHQRGLIAGVMDTLLWPFALVFLIVYAAAGRSAFVSLGPGHTLLLIGGGLVTVTPLIFFGYAASRVSLVLHTLAVWPMRCAR
jgi:EamA domain-containing membrane protein RarD